MGVWIKYQHTCLEILRYDLIAENFTQKWSPKINGEKKKMVLQMQRWSDKIVGTNITLWMVYDNITMNDSNQNENDQK